MSDFNENADTQKFQFLGRVLPESLPISVSAPAIRVQNPKNGLDITMQIEIDRSSIVIEGIANRFDQTDFGLVFRRALHLANAAVGLVAFATGGGVRPILEEFIGPDGKRVPINPLEARLQKFCTAYGVEGDRAEDFHQTFLKVATTPQLFLALNDLVSGLYDPDEGPIVCARAVETLRRFISANDAEPAEQWKQMHTALRVSADYLKPITAISLGPRHGDRIGALDGNLPEIAERAWTVMDRTLLYCRRANGPLPEADFPML